MRYPRLGLPSWLYALGIASLAAASIEPRGVLHLKPHPSVEEAPASFASRVTPIAVRVLQGSSLSGRPDSLTDRDTASGLLLSGSTSVVFDLEQEMEIESVRLYGSHAFTLSVHSLQDGAWVPAAGLLNVPVDRLEAGWNVLVPRPVFSASSLRLDLVPLGALADVPEIEIWAATEAPIVPAVEAQLLSRADATHSPAWRVFAGPPGETAVETAPRTVSIDVPREVSQLRRTYLAYELCGVNSWRGVPRALNGRAFAGGVLDAPTTEWATQIERIDPTWLREGPNSITFGPSFGDLPYAVRQVRLIVELDTGANAVERVELAGGDVERAMHAAVDGDASTSWSSGPDGVLTLALDRQVQISGLALLLGAVAPGTVEIRAVEPDGGQSVLSAYGADRLRTGWNLLPVPYGRAAARLQVIFQAGAGGQWEVVELVPIGSGVGPRAEPGIVLSWPTEGQFRGREAYLRGFAPLDASGRPPRILVGTTPVETEDGAFGVTVAKDDIGLASEEDAAPWSVAIEAVYADGRVVRRLVPLTRFQPGPESIDGRLLAARTFSVRPDQAHRIRHDGASLDLEAGSVEAQKELKITPLAEESLPGLDVGLTNVTRSPRRGYRFEPHGTRFIKPVRISLPYDPALLPEGMTEKDVEAFFFDDQAGRWKPLHKLEMSEGKVIALTDHFTDMIAGTLSLPDHPDSFSHDPTVFQRVPPADPAERIVLIESPKATSTGDTQVRYPFDLPPGRAGMTPDLALEYSSASGNGWLGMGWSLALPAVVVDTRWGAPRFDAVLETETYSLGGEQLTPGAHRGDLVPRSAEKRFHFRREGAFARMVRHGGDPASYWWEVTDKLGRVSIFGGTPNTVLADDLGRISRWLLRETRDPHGNGIRYGYARVDDAGLPSGTVRGRQLYLKEIEYTTFEAERGAFVVRFLRDGDLAEPPRPDVQIDARGGFKEVTSQLLRQVEVDFAGATVRSWELRYSGGAFEKTLLASLTQRGADGSILATHRFTYHDDVRQGDAYLGFAPSESWTTGDDEVRSAAVDAVASVAGSDAGRATALSGYETTHAGSHLYAGFNPSSPSKQGSGGAKIGFTGTVDSEGLLALVDLNGDHLPDKVFRDGSTTFLRLNRSGPRGTTEFGPPIPLPTLPAISEESASIFSSGLEAYFVVSVTANLADGITSGRVYLADVNGDGLPDLVDGETVLFNRLDASGIPTFDPDSAGSPVPVGPATVDPATLPDYGQIIEGVLERAPLHDTLRRWMAPFPGQIAIAGDVALLPAPSGSFDMDGVRVTIQHNGTELWSAMIGADDPAPVTPTGVASIPVQKGDRLYFRVQSRHEGSHDAVSWDPEVVYVGAPQPDANGLDPWRYRASEDFVFAGRSGILTKLPFTGRVRLVGNLQKTGVTSDDVVLLVLKNGTQVHADMMSWDDVGDIVVNGLDFDVQQGDTLQLRVKVDSGIDLAKIVWAPSLHYVGPPDVPSPTVTTDGVTRTIDRIADEDGNPLIQLHPAYDIDFYPVNDLVAPQTPWVAEKSETVTIGSQLLAQPGTYGVVFLTAKRNGELAAKRAISIVNGMVENRQVDLEVEVGDRIFLDYSCLDPDLASEIYNRVIGVDGVPAPSAFHTTVRQGVFPSAYRGWAVAGYNGSARQEASIHEADLNVTFDEDSTLDPRTDKAYLFTPFAELGLWRGPEEETAVYAGGARSSRLGPNSIHIAGVETATGRAPVRLSSSDQSALQLGVAFLSGSASEGGGGSDLDFLDMNGDRFPDVVGRARIQYSPSVGGLEPGSEEIAALEFPRRSDGSAENVGVGGSPANFRVGSRGHVDTPGRGGAQKENDTRPQMVALGLSGSLGSGSSSLSFDLVDLNGDGLPDRVSESGGTLTVAFNLGYGFAAPERWGAGALSRGTSQSESIGTTLGFNGGIYDYAGGLSLSRNTSETTAMLADVNGDGLADRLRRDGDLLRVGLNAGNGFLPDTEWGGAPEGSFATSTDASVGGGAYFTVGIGPVCLFGCWIILNPGLDVSTSLARQESALLDVDGDGYLDHVASSDDAAMTVGRNTTGRTNLLRSIERPLGARIEIDYAREGNTPEQPQSRWVLSRVTLHDGLPGDGVDTQLATFRYEGGVWDRLEREFYGYATVVEEVRDTSQGEAIHRTISREHAVDSFYTRGLLRRERLADGTGRPFLETQHTFEVVDVATQAPLADLKSTTATGFPALRRTDRRFFEGQPAPGKTTFATQEFDVLGNVVRTTDAGDQGPEDDLEATLEYASCADTHIVGVPVGITLHGNGVELRRRRAMLDCATGDLAEITEYLADGRGAQTTLDHDGFGNLVRLLGPPNRGGQRFELRYDYDPEARTHVTRITDSFGYASTKTWDVAQGRRTSEGDIAGNTTTYTYDAHGRLISMRGPNEQGPAASPPTLVFEHHPEAAVPWSLTRHLDTFRDRSDPIDAVRFVDGLGRIVQDKSDAAVVAGSGGPPADVMTVSGRVRFDAAGRITDRWYPVTEPRGTPGVFKATYDTMTPTHTTFDVQDRPLTVTLPDGTATATTHGFGENREGVPQFEARTVDAKGVASLRYRDVRDNVTGVKQLNRVGGVVQEIWTSFGHDALKRLIRITDDRHNVTGIVWDNLDRKVVVDSPDAGRTEDVYDLAGNRNARITANLGALGQRIVYDHHFKRLERIRYPAFPGNDVTYTYGGPGTPGNGPGRLVRVVDPSGTRERVYGKLGEMVSETRTIASADGSPPHTYVSQYVHDSFDRLQRMTYPDGEVLTFRYDSGGRLRQITGRKGPYDYAYLNRMEYDKFGEHAFMEQGNGTRTTYAYRPDNRYLQHVLATRSDGRPFVNQSYAHDEVGNVLSRTNEVPLSTGSDFGGPTEQTFAYDDLDRMLSSRGTYQVAPSKIDRYLVTFDYDTIHNTTSRNQFHEIVQPSGSAVLQHKTTYASAYHYGGPQPHAATHIGERSFAYDGNGNQLGWQHDGNGTRRQIVWDEENRMQSVFENGHQIRFVYDDAGERVVKRGPQGETVYVSPWLTVRNGTTGTKHVWAGPMRIASKLLKQERPGSNPSGDMPFEKDRYFFHQDQAGSTQFVTDAAGKLYEHLEYFPFGETWVQESTNTQRTPYLFTGKELDEETGLYYLGARYFDPRLGSFNSGEPLLFESPEKSQADPRFLAAYGYAYQNPERYLDPDGRDVIILVGQPGSQQNAENRILRRGYPAAAKAFKRMLAKEGIKAHIVDMSKTTKGSKAMLAAKAKAIQGKGEKVSGLVYIGHGDITNGGIYPRTEGGEDDQGESLTVREAVDASKLEDGGAMIAWGCEVSVEGDADSMRDRGIAVHTTRGGWTYTTASGMGATGTRDKRQTPYRKIWGFRLSNVTESVDPGSRPLDYEPPTLRESILDAEKEVNGTK